MQKSQHTDEAIRDASPYYSSVAPYGELSGGGDTFGIAEIVGLVRRRFEIIVIIAVIGTSLAAVYGYTRPPIYSSTATLLIEPENRVVDLDSVVDGVGSDAIAIETQVNLLHSPGFLEGFIQTKRDQDLSSQQLMADLGQVKLPDDYSAMTSRPLATDSGQGSKAETNRGSFDWNVGSLANGLTVTQQGRSYLINVSFSSTDPEKTAAVANDLARHYIDEQTVRRRQITIDASSVLSERLAALKDELLEAEQTAELYRQTNLSSDGDSFDVTTDQIADLTSLLVKARADRMEKQARLAYIQDLENRGGSLESLTEVIQSPHMASLWGAESELRKRSAELRLELGDNHPTIQSLESERQELKTGIDLEISRIIFNTKNELDVLVARETSLSDDIKKMTSKSNQAGIQMRILKADALASRQIYEEFLLRFKQTSQQEAVIQANTRLIANAKVPNAPSNRSPLSYALIGFVGSSVLGCGLAFLRDKTDKSLRSGKEVANELGLQCLGLVPRMKQDRLKGRKLHEYLIKRPVSVYADSIRSIHTKLSLMDPESAPQTIQITSSLPQEGKTTFAVSLATLLALDGKRTILLDLDLRHPSVGREISLDGCMSADKFLRGEEVNLDPSLVKCDKRSGCYILGVQEAVDDPSKLLRSASLKALIEALRIEYEQIVIDGPPSLGLSDSKALLTYADALLFIVHWNQTSKENAIDSIDELKQCNAPIAGAVLTQVNLSKQRRYGYQGMDSYYGKHDKYYKN